MKKIIFVLMFSLGLVSVANAESVCNSFSIEDWKNDIVDEFGLIHKFAEFDAGSYGNNAYEKAKKSWDKLVMRYHTGEIKKSDKETLCIYMATIGRGYLDIQLTPQEIERFERFLVEKDAYSEYEDKKDDFLKTLKLFKYYNKLDAIYNKKSTEFSDLFGNVVFGLKLWGKDRYIINVRRFIYGKYVNKLSNADLMFGNNDPTIQSIAKWAESKLKESK